MQTFNPAPLSTKKYSQGLYEVAYPKKYKSQHQPVYRSSWERDYMVMCDLNPAIIEWGSEPFSIQYFCPKDKVAKNYWVDFMVRYLGRDGKVHTKLIEIKPYKQTRIELAKTKRDKLIVYINYAKWAAAYKFCQENNFEFEVVTEYNLYGKQK